MAINTSVKHILTAGQFNKEDLENILQRTEVMEKECKSGEVNKLLTNKIVACIFFEPSTRTRLSFSAAALKLGAQIISAENAALDFSVHKGESIEDTARMILSHADLMVMRHPRAGSVSLAAEVAKKPAVLADAGSPDIQQNNAEIMLTPMEKKAGMLLFGHSASKAKLEELLGAEYLGELESKLLPHAEDMRFRCDAEVGGHSSEEQITADMLGDIERAISKERFKMKFL